MKGRSFLDRRTVSTLSYSDSLQKSCHTGAVYDVQLATLHFCDAISVDTRFNISSASCLAIPLSDPRVNESPSLSPLPSARR